MSIITLDPRLQQRLDGKECVYVDISGGSQLSTLQCVTVLHSVLSHLRFRMTRNLFAVGFRRGDPVLLRDWIFDLSGNPVRAEHVQKLSSSSDFLAAKTRNLPRHILVVINCESYNHRNLKLNLLEMVLGLKGTCNLVLFRKFNSRSLACLPIPDLSLKVLDFTVVSQVEHNKLQKCGFDSKRMACWARLKPDSSERSTRLCACRTECPFYDKVLFCDILATQSSIVGGCWLPKR